MSCSPRLKKRTEGGCNYMRNKPFQTNELIMKQEWRSVPPQWRGVSRNSSKGRREKWAGEEEWSSSEKGGQERQVKVVFRRKNWPPERQKKNLSQGLRAYQTHVCDCAHIGGLWLDGRWRGHSATCWIHIVPHGGWRSILQLRVWIFNTLRFQFFYCVFFLCWRSFIKAL